MSQTYVLVTGAWHGGWAWRPVAQRLRAAGHRVLTPTLPALADGDDPTRYQLTDVADFLVDLVGSTADEVTLVGHSWGGYPMTAAANRLGSRVTKVVYWSAFVPDAGAALIDEVPPAYAELFRGAAAASGDDSIVLPFEVWQGAFMQDAPEVVQRLVFDLLVPQPLQYFTAAVEPLDGAIARAYVLSVDDVALPPGEYGWARFADRLGVDAIDAPGSHEACFTAPDGLAEALLKA
ncbi:MAG: alpha/beta fold hydrolase [Pseudonocardia sp.]